MLLEKRYPLEKFVGTPTDYLTQKHRIWRKLLITLGDRLIQHLPQEHARTLHLFFLESNWTCLLVGGQSISPDRAENILAGQSCSNDRAESSWVCLLVGQSMSP